MRHCGIRDREPGTGNPFSPAAAKFRAVGTWCMGQKSRICLYIISFSALSDGPRNDQEVRSNIKSNPTDDHNPWFLFRIHKKRYTSLHRDSSVFEHIESFESSISPVGSISSFSSPS